MLPSLTIATAKKIGAPAPFFTSSDIDKWMRYLPPPGATPAVGPEGLH